MEKEEKANITSSIPPQFTLTGGKVVRMFRRTLILI